MPTQVEVSHEAMPALRVERFAFVEDVQLYMWFREPEMSDDDE